MAKGQFDMKVLEHEKQLCVNLRKLALDTESADEFVETAIRKHLGDFPLSLFRLEMQRFGAKTLDDYHPAVRKAFCKKGDEICTTV